ncbi:uncharacterized protein STEHIDRAFT_57583 [Stereum hirsutum FP-91666 SS1]|uniref:uncharacterized protein n=1 Tax=Stereum hirsutum (strain FP-91666) TaxID=721885 RepID=UPI000440B119|nr:uncharacterized protein STEHIDRAFT_57583 [Stereum hirsutum FP-91666 SS1]EIM86542.1 hypothetical protein STEHIDRAFT_57583 [Stereum hirsutum FP-91666 SS1]
MSTYSSSESDPPPSYYSGDSGSTVIPTLYDDTHRGVSAFDYSIMSMGNRANLIGYLEHHDPTSDGSFSICIAGGNGACVSKRLYESIPAQHRPLLNTQDNSPVTFLTGSSQTALGSTIMPVILTNKRTGKKFRVKIYALVLENLLMGMFIGGPGGAGPFKSMAWGGGVVTHGLEVGPDQEVVEVAGC